MYAFKYPVPTFVLLEKLQHFENTEIQTSLNVKQSVQILHGFLEICFIQRNSFT